MFEIYYATIKGMKIMTKISPQTRLSEAKEIQYVR